MGGGPFFHPRGWTVTQGANLRSAVGNTKVAQTLSCKRCAAHRCHVATWAVSVALLKNTALKRSSSRILMQSFRKYGELSETMHKPEALSQVARSPARISCPLPRSRNPSSCLNSHILPFLRSAGDRPAGWRPSQKPF